MPQIIDPETLHVDDLPAIWSPIQWEITEEERIKEVEDQARASLLWAVDAPEAILRLLLDETAITRLYDPPKGYNPEEQGEWNPDLITFGFNRRVRLERIEREPDCLTLEYDVADLGTWLLEITPERVIIERV